MTSAKKEFEEWEELESYYFGDANEAVDHGVTHEAAMKAAGRRRPCVCCRDYATNADGDYKARVWTWRSPKTYADCYRHALRCKSRPDATLYHHVLIPFVEQLVDGVTTGDYEELVWPEEIEADYEPPPERWRKEMKDEVAEGLREEDVEVVVGWEALNALQFLATKERESGVPLAAADRHALLRTLRGKLEEDLKDALHEARMERISGLGDISEWFFTGTFQLSGTNIGGSYGYVHRHGRGGMRFVEMNTRKKRK